jgi:murein tripeptide amidase MpaA
VFFAHFQPYTYSDLRDYIYSLKRKGSPDFIRNCLRVQKLCDTLQSNTCYVLSITENVYEANMHKQVIYLTSRVHPGESNSSFMVQGVLDFLLQPHNREAQTLRELFIFKVVPMLNPDGVTLGNYRCNSLGVDLNRRWLNPSKLLHPTIYYAK